MQVLHSNLKSLAVQPLNVISRAKLKLKTLKTFAVVSMLPCSPHTYIFASCFSKILYFSASNIFWTGGSVETVGGVTERPAPKPEEFDASEGRWRRKHCPPQDLKPLRRGLTGTGRDGAGRLL